MMKRVLCIGMVLMLLFGALGCAAGANNEVQEAAATSRLQTVLETRSFDCRNGKLQYPLAFRG